MPWRAARSRIHAAASIPRAGCAGAAPEADRGWVPPRVVPVLDL